MTARPSVKLTKRTVDSLCVSSGDTVFWDRDLPGFGVRVYASGRKVWCVQARPPRGRPRRVRLGGLGDLTPDQARGEAAAVIDRIRQGLPMEPEAPEPTVSDLAERYLESHVRVNCKPATVVHFSRAVKLHIVPALGHLPLSELERSHAFGLHGSLRDRPVLANRVMDVLSAMFRLAVAWGMTPPRRNPCGTVRRYRENPRERFLSPDEYRRLGVVLRKAEAEGAVFPPVIFAIRLLLLTGCRRNEVLALRWDDIDRSSGEVRIREGKTGPRSVPLTPAVERVLESIPREEGSPWVIAGKYPKSHLKELNRAWLGIRKQAKLEDVRLHDLRHSWASRGLALGEGLSVIGKLLGHSNITTTARYAHLMRDAEKASAAKVGGSIGSDLLQSMNAA
ncbi:MAG: tyrosine-type recombinase/integrase [Gammaproteobacteria bacterium]|nr:tyrosine-type recombinase/integrase [Gammaproteobacteria bacterium]